MHRALRPPALLCITHQRPGMLRMATQDQEASGERAELGTLCTPSCSHDSSTVLGGLCPPGPPLGPHLQCLGDSVSPAPLASPVVLVFILQFPPGFRFLGP